MAYTLAGLASTATSWAGTHALTVSPQFGLTLAGVSCTSSTTCLAVGSMLVQSTTGSAPTYFYRPLAEMLSGATWTAISPPGCPVASGAALAACSCDTSSSCQAVGSYTGSGSSGTRTGVLIESLSGTTWAPITDLETQAAGTASATLGSSTRPVERRHVSRPGHTSTPITRSMPSSGRCPAPGGPPQLVLDPTGLSSPAYTGVSCPTSGRCEAVGNGSTGSGALAPHSCRLRLPRLRRRCKLASRARSNPEGLSPSS